MSKYLAPVTTCSACRSFRSLVTDTDLRNGEGRRAKAVDAVDQSLFDVLAIVKQMHDAHTQPVIRTQLEPVARRLGKGESLLGMAMAWKEESKGVDRVSPHCSSGGRECEETPLYNGAGEGLGHRVSRGWSCKRRNEAL